jgi:hypothetical protein
VEHEVDAYIAKRHEARVRDEGEQATEEVWMELSRQDAERMRDELAQRRAAWGILLGLLLPALGGIQAQKQREIGAA